MLLTKPKMAAAVGMTAVVCFAILLLVRDERSEGTELKAGQKAAEQAATVSTAQPTAQPSRAAPAAASAQAPGRIRVGPNVHVSKGLSDLIHWEVILAEGVGRGGDLFAASMVFSPSWAKAAANSISAAVVVYASRDGGKTWAPVLDSNREFKGDANQIRRFFQDPTLACGPDGEVYFAYNELSRYKSKTDAGEGRSIEVVHNKQWLRIVRSSDGGRTWEQALAASGFGQGFGERPFLAVDRGIGRYKGRVYCSTGDGLFVSDDGRSFRKARAFERKPFGKRNPFGNPVVLADDTLAVAVGESPMPRGFGREKHGFIGLRTSSDGGNSWSEERVVAKSVAAPDILYAGSARMAVDPMRPGRLYLAWQDRLPSGRAGIHYAASTDKGQTFSDPVLLSEQSKEPDYDAFLPSIAVNAVGTVAVTWYDTRAIKRGQEGWDVRLRASTDGGKTWVASVRVTEQTILQDKKTQTYGGVGHTAGLLADADGGFHCLWVDCRTGVAQAWTARVETDETKKGQR
jgi:hypothetical protein